MSELVEKAENLHADMKSKYITENFLWSELTCSCCDNIKIVPGVFLHMARLQIMRSEIGMPIHVNSGYRCPKHNIDVGGAARSWHLLFATDVRPNDYNPKILKVMYRLAIMLKFGGIGLYEEDGFIHLDMRPKQMRWRG